jgi:Protein of unknown function (DUF2934)
MNSMLNESTLFRQGEPSDDDLIRLAYEYWQERGCPDGSPELDWLKAEETFRARNAAAG